MSPSQESNPKAPKTLSVSFTLAASFVERLRDASYHTRIPMSQIVQEATARYIEQLEEETNKGKPFPARTANPRPGRPIGS